MEKINKKILLKREIQTVDTDNDGVADSIVFKPIKPINIQFTLNEDIKNIGLYTENKEEEE
jgi:hypothetical protein